MALRCRRTIRICPIQSLRKPGRFGIARSRLAADSLSTSVGPTPRERVILDRSHNGSANNDKLRNPSF